MPSLDQGLLILYHKPLDLIQLVLSKPRLFTAHIGSSQYFAI